MNASTLFPTRIVLCAIASCWLGANAADAVDQSGGGPEMPPPRAIPGLTTEDRFPGGCVDCHVNDVETGMDHRLSTLLTRWNEAVEPEVLEFARSVSGPAVILEGSHPRVPAARMEIPGDCLVCHESGLDDVVPLAPFLHKVHLAGGEQSVFLRIFQGECTHCHKLDVQSGQWRIPDRSESP